MYMKWMYKMRTFHSQGDIILYDFLKCLKTELASLCSILYLAVHSCIKVMHFRKKLINKYIIK